MSAFDLFDTWLGFLGIVIALVLAAVYGWRPLRSGLVGYACGVALVVVLNGLSREPVPCLQNAKGGQILSAYSTNCAKAEVRARDDLLPKK